MRAEARRVRPVRHPYDLADFMIDFLPSVDRLVRRDGIHLFGLRYWDDVLSVWAGRLDRPLRVSYDPRDTSRIFVRAPDGTRWPIRFADLRRPPITLSANAPCPDRPAGARFGVGRRATDLRND